ncbi:hypothetical protein [Gemmata massiliana]|uniref:hypothetical protein n=1 Tax=Gemmata massiliana TaxID=1210884 RepID=UPI0013A6E8D4|nr:hypothetical protein [Gemmata massiliana]
MLRFFVALPCLFSVVLALTAAPVPKHLFPKNGPPCFPVKLGTKWVYECHTQGTVEEMTEIITNVEDKEGFKIVTVGRFAKDDSPSPWETWAVSDQKLIRLEFFGEKHRVPLCHLKLPVETGLSWTHEDDKLRFSFTTVSVERVKVPAGEFEAVRMQIQVNGSATSHLWYAPAIGKIKEEVAGFEYVLKSFSLGQDQNQK